MLLKNRRLEEAQVLYENFIGENGERGIIMTNLAKVYAEQGKRELATETLWKSLLLDPNIANAVGWYAAIENERGGRSAYVEALHRVAAIPGSWNAQLWLARVDLEQGNSARALAIYREAIPRAKGDSEALMMISGDLGKSGHAREALDLVLPVFSVAAHGYKPALNLLQACVQLREVSIGNKLLAELKSLRRPDLLQYVNHFEHALKSA